MNIVLIILGIVLIASVYGGLNFYIASRVFRGIAFLFPGVNGKIFAVVYVFLALSMIIGFLRLPLPYVIKSALNWIGSYWMGIFVYLLLFFLLADALLLLGGLIRLVPSPLPPRLRFFASLTAVLITLGLIAAGVYNANRTKQVSYDIKTEKAALSDKMNIVLISDVHLGSLNSERRLAGIVKEVNALKPDLVCIAGDVFSNGLNALENPDRASALFKSISSKYGVYACLGNHDGGRPFDEMLDFYAKSDIRLLNDEYVTIDGRLVLFGRVDALSIGGFGELKRKNDGEINEIIASLDADMPIVVMDHSPARIGRYGKETDLILCGHTHGGQIFPVNFITKALFAVDYGYYQKDKDSPKVIVTSGVNTWEMPLRVGTNNEIVNIKLY